MKIIICFIIIIILLYFCFKMRENFSPKITNIIKGANINIDEQGDWEFQNYSVEDYTNDYETNFETNILFYKFEKDSSFELTPNYNNSLTLGFYL